MNYYYDVLMYTVQIFDSEHRVNFLRETLTSPVQLRMLGSNQGRGAAKRRKEIALL